jgi:hypothetical protein
MTSNIISVNPEQISNILSLCPICYDIQNKILILYIGTRETPIKTKIDQMKKYHTKVIYPERTLTSYCKDLSLINYVSWVHPEYTEEEDEDPDPQPIYLPEYLYDLMISFSLYSSDKNKKLDEYDEYTTDHFVQLKAVTKIRLHRMIEEGKPYNI